MAEEADAIFGSLPPQATKQGLICVRPGKKTKLQLYIKFLELNSRYNFFLSNVFVMKVVEETFRQLLRMVWCL